MKLIARAHPRTQMIVGLAVVVLGLLFLIDNLGWIDLDVRRLVWPAILLIAGVLKLSQTRSQSGNVLGVVLVAIGSVGVLRGIGFIDFEWRDIWPLVLIAAGIAIVYKASITNDGRKDGSSASHGAASRDSDADSNFGSSSASNFSSSSGSNFSGSSGSKDGSGAEPFAHRAAVDEGYGEFATFQAPPAKDVDEEVVNVTSVMGASNRRVTSSNFRGGEITAILGNSELDLRQASIHGEAVLNVFSLLGGVTIKVPLDWVIVMEGAAILGGYEEKTVPPTATHKRLIVRGYAILGGLEVRN